MTENTGTLPDLSLPDADARARAERRETVARERMAARVADLRAEDRILPLLAPRAVPDGPANQA